jgi:hypothetical protein
MSAERFTPSDPDGPCQKCGKWALDTGWECTECGYDNLPWFYPEGEEKRRAKEGER